MASARGVLISLNLFSRHQGIVQKLMQRKAKLGDGEAGEESVFNRNRVSVQGDEILWRRTVVMDAQLCECT